MGLYTKAIELDPQNAVFYANRAFAHIKLEEYGSAVADASEAIAADGSYAKARAYSSSSSRSSCLRAWGLPADVRCLPPLE